MKFGLQDSDWQLVQNLVVLALKKKGALVWIYGSRARGDYQTYSDLDILYNMKKPLSLPELGILREALEDSNLPIKVDIAYEADLASGYLKNILKDRIEV